MKIFRLVFGYACVTFFLNASESKQKSQDFRDCIDSLSSIEKRRFNAITQQEKDALAQLLHQKIAQCLELNPSKKIDGFCTLEQA